MAKPLFLLSQQRSGTNYFRSLMDSGGDIYGAYKEVFDPNIIETRESFWTFCNSLERAELDPDRRVGTFSKFLDHLGDGLDEKYFVVDIKYNSLHHLQGYWWEPVNPLVRFIRQNNYKMVHLIRRNVFAATVSQIRANKTGQYTLKGDRPNLDNIFLDPLEFEPMLRQRNRLIVANRGMIQGDFVREVFYEDLIEQDSIQEEMIKLYEFIELDQSNDTFSSEYRKILPSDLSSYIENYDQIKGLVEKYWIGG